ncbi:MAG: TRAP transporter TatT component family protein [Deltaproteobacteria bacterium]
MIPVACALALAVSPPSFDALFAQRLDPAALDRALVVLREWTTAQPGDARALVLLARAEGFWSDLHPDEEPSAADAHLEIGIRAGGAALVETSPAFEKATQAGGTLLASLDRVEPSGALALYWIAADQHRLAARHGLVWLLLEAPELRRLFERVAALAPATFHGGAFRHLAELELALPAGFGATLGRARDALELADRFGPAFLGNSLVWAERYAVKAQDYGLFQRRIETLLESTPDGATDIGPENELARRRARRLGEHASELFTRAAIEAATTGRVSSHPVANPDGGMSHNPP